MGCSYSCDDRIKNIKDNINTQSFMDQISKSNLNKEEYDLQKYVKILLKFEIDNVAGIKKVSDQQWKSMNFPIDLVNEIKKELSKLSNQSLLERHLQSTDQNQSQRKSMNLEKDKNKPQNYDNPQIYNRKSFSAQSEQINSKKKQNPRKELKSAEEPEIFSEQSQIKYFINLDKIDEQVQKVLSQKVQIPKEVFEMRIIKCIQSYYSIKYDGNLNSKCNSSQYYKISLCYFEILLSGFNDEEILHKYINRFIDAQNKALYYGLETQTKEWIVQLMVKTNSLNTYKIVKKLNKDADTLQQKGDKLESILQKINPNNFLIIMVISWKVSKIYFKLSACELDKKNYKKGIYLIDKSHQYFQRFLSCKQSISSDSNLEHLTLINHKQVWQINDMERQIQHHTVLIKSWIEMKNGENKISQATQKDDGYDEDLVYEAIDSFKQAINISFEVDAEVEVISLAHIGKIFYRCLKNPVKAKFYYNDCIRMLETLKPKVFFQEKWHKLMMKHLSEITDEQNKNEAMKQSVHDLKMLEKYKKEIEELEKVSLDAIKFLKLLSEKYVSYKNEKVKFSEQDLKLNSLKKTLIKATVHYHPDKKCTLTNWSEIFGEKEIYLREIIIRKLNGLNQQFK